MDPRIKLELENDPPRYRPGEPVRGCVRVRTREATKHGRVRVAPTWTCRSEVHRTEIVLDAGGVWPAGTDRRYPFAFPAPSGPLTFVGQRFSVRWMLEATAEVGWLHLPSAAKDIELVRWTAAAPFAQGAGYRTAPVRAPDTYDCGPTAPPPTVTDDGSMRRGASTFGELAFKVRRLRLRHALGGPIHVSAPDRAAAGDVLDVHVTLPPRATITHIDVALGAQEVVLDQDPRDGWWEPDYYQLVEPVPAQDGDATRLTARLRVPEDASPSFFTKSARVEWMIETVCTTRDGAEWRERRPLLVLPPGVSRVSA